ncbi:MAG: hypothetical protein GXO86_07085 [Chlorobi bacterium]|nr:hypothetical protein [Chlorobiota bacterium]
MDSQIEQLLEKYWEGETSPEEEKKLKAYFKQYPEAPEAQYFRKIASDRSTLPDKPFIHPGRKIQRAWLSVAAAVLIGLISLPFVLQQRPKADPYAVSDPQEALEITRASLMMVSQGLNKGKSYTYELTKLDDAREVLVKEPRPKGRGY